MPPAVCRRGRLIGVAVMSCSLDPPDDHAALVAVRRIVAEQTEPRTPVDHVSFLARGSMNLTYRLNGDLVARLPIEANDFTRHGHELLRFLGSRGVPVPAVTAFGEPGPRFPLPFVVYRYVEGQPLTSELLRRQPAPRRRAVREALGAALEALAAIPAADALAATGCPDLGPRDLFGAWVEKQLGSLASRDLEAATIYRRRWRDEPALAARWTALVHMDFNPDNLLLDTASGRIGLIDVEGVAVGHPIFQHLMFARHYGLRAAKRQLARRAIPRRDELWIQLEFAHELWRHATSRDTG